MTTGGLNVPGVSPVPYGSAIIDGTDIVRPSPLYTGDIRVPVSSSYQKPGQVALEQDEPLPLNVIAFIREVSPGDIPEDTPKRRSEAE